MASRAFSARPGLEAVSTKLPVEPEPFSKPRGASGLAAERAMAPRGVAGRLGPRGRPRGRGARLGTVQASLAALNPTAVLARGYAIALDTQGQAVRDGGRLSAGERLHLRFAKGAAEAVVAKTAG